MLLNTVYLASDSPALETSPDNSHGGNTMVAATLDVVMQICRRGSAGTTSIGHKFPGSPAKLRHNMFPTAVSPFSHHDVEGLPTKALVLEGPVLRCILSLLCMIKLSRTLRSRSRSVSSLFISYHNSYNSKQYGAIT